MKLRVLALSVALASATCIADPVFYPDRQLELHKQSCSKSNSTVEDYAKNVADYWYALPATAGVNKVNYPAYSSHSNLLGQIGIKDAASGSYVVTGTAKQLSSNKGNLTAVKALPAGSYYFRLILVSSQDSDDKCYYNSESFEVYNRPEIDSIDVSPKEAESGSSFEFSVDLKDDIPPSYNLEVDFGAGYKTMTDKGSNNYSYKSIANTVGNNRVFEIRIIDQNGDVVDNESGTYTVTEKQEQQYRPNLTISSVPSDISVGVDACFSFKAEDENSDLKQLEVNFDGSQNMPLVYSYSNNTSSKTVQLCHTYQDTGTYTVTAKAIDHTDRFDSERADITVSAVIKLEIESVGVTPKEAESGSEFEFNAVLKRQASAGEKVQVDFGAGYKTMTDKGSNNYSYKSIANTVGNNRVFEIRIIDQNGDVVDNESGTYTVTEKQEQQYSPELTISVPSPNVKAGDRVCFAMNAQDANSDLKQLEINFGDDPLHIPEVHSYSDNSSNETVRPCHFYEEVGSYTVTAKLFDHTNRFDSKSINITVSVNDEPADEPPVISSFLLDVDENGRVTGSFKARHASEQVRLKAEYSDNSSFDNAKTLLFNNDLGLQPTGDFDFWIEPGSSWDSKTMYVRLLVWSSDGTQTSPPPVESVLIPGASGEILLSVDEDKSKIPSCKNYKHSKYCVPADKQITVALKVDSEQSIKSIEINKDGSNDSPMVFPGDNLSDGYALINLSYSEAEYFSDASDTDWAKDIELSAVAISDKGLRSGKAVLTMRLYSYSSFTEAEEEKVRLAQEKERLAQEQEANEQFAIAKREECLDTRGEIKLPESLDTTLKPNDPLVYNQDGDPVECAPFNRTQHRQMFDRWGNGSAAEFKPTLEANFAGDGLRDSTSWKCVNYPATVRATFIDSDGEVNYLPDADGIMVNNYRHKSYVMEQLGVALYEEFSRLGVDGFTPVCKSESYSELTDQEIFEIIESHPEFEPTYRLIFDKFKGTSGKTLFNAYVGLKKGQLKAIKEILADYADIVKQSPEVVYKIADTTLKAAQSVLQGQYAEVISNAKAGLQDIPTELAELGKDTVTAIGETIPLIKPAIDSWSLEDMAFYYGYFMVHIAHEIAPTSKIKALKLLKHASLPKWLTEAHLISRFAAANIIAPNRSNKILAKLTSSERNWLFKAFLGKSSKYYSETEIELLEMIKRNDRSWVVKVLKGRAFDNYRKGAYPYREVLICKIPSCGKIGKSAYYRLDGLNIDSGRIVSRKYTQLDLVSEKTGKSYVDELLAKYSDGQKIADTPSTRDMGINGIVFNGQPVLEIPKQRNGEACDIPPLVKVARYFCEYLKEINEKRKASGKAAVTVNAVDIDIELEL